MEVLEGIGGYWRSIGGVLEVLEELVLEEDPQHGRQGMGLWSPTTCVYVPLSLWPTIPLAAYHLCWPRLPMKNDVRLDSSVSRVIRQIF